MSDVSEHSDSEFYFPKKKRERERKAQWSYDKMLIDWVRSGRTGKYLARGHRVRIERCEVRAPWPSAKSFPVRPDLTQSISTYYAHEHKRYWFNIKPMVSANPASSNWPLVVLWIEIWIWPLKAFQISVIFKTLFCFAFQILEATAVFFNREKKGNLFHAKTYKHCALWFLLIEVLL